jgi:hypothetical protein
MTCPFCNSPVAFGSKFCPNCGSTIPSTIQCQQCGTALKPTDKFCPNCGCGNQSTPSMEQPQTYAPQSSSYDNGRASQEEGCLNAGASLPWYLKMLIGVSVVTLIKMIAC